MSCCKKCEMVEILKGRGYKIPKKMTKKQMAEILKGSGILGFGTENEPDNMTKTEMTNVIKDYGYKVPKNISVENLEKVVESGSGYRFRFRGGGTEPDISMTKTEMINEIKDYGYNVPKNISVENLEKVVESGSGYGMSGYGFYKSPHKFKKLNRRHIRKFMRGGGDPMAAMMAWGKKVGNDFHSWGRQAEADMNAWGRKVEADMNAWGRLAEQRLRAFGDATARMFNDPNFQIQFLEALAQISGPLATAFSFIPGVGQVLTIAYSVLNMGAELVAQHLRIIEAEKEAFKQYVVAEAQARAAAEASLKTLFEQKVQAFMEIMKATKARKEALARELEIPVADVDDPVKVVAARAAKAQRIAMAALEKEKSDLAIKLGIPRADVDDTVKLRTAQGSYDLRLRCRHFTGYPDELGESAQCQALKGTPGITMPEAMRLAHEANERELARFNAQLGIT